MVTSDVTFGIVAGEGGDAQATEGRRPSSPGDGDRLDVAADRTRRVGVVLEG
jgi:hypothetical protein